MAKTLVIFSLILLLALAVSSQSVERPAMRAENVHAANGLKLLESGEYAKAGAEFDSVLKQEPDNVQAIYLRGMCKFMLREMKDAQADFERVLKLSPPKSPGIEKVYANLGNTYYFHRELDKAQASFEKALAINPGHLAAYAGLGNVLSDKKDFNGALTAFDKALTAPKHPSQAYILIPSYIGRGDIYFKQNKLDLALADFDSVLELAPNLPASSLERGIVYALMGRWTLALTDIRNSLDLLAAPRPDIGKVSSFPGTIDRVVADLDEYIAQNSTNAKAWAVRGLIRLLRNDRNGAKDDFAKSFQLDPVLKAEIEPDINAIIKTQTNQ
ncbi:MAG TPA: tetratricopeptide repeat protein [Pyrinomonadaceae bacterium]|jgi:tetratricopeptide (TPR) repeat protein|nr:tetratricopeptide repeat protein [Pyrinomonadaceae bacterium]